MTNTAQLPAIPETVPVVTTTSNSEDNGPEYYGIDPARQWWCETVLRPRFGDARASVLAPGAGATGEPLVSVTLPADDLDDAEETARYATDVARQLVRLLTDDDAAMEQLKNLLAPSGPMGGTSSAAWHKVLGWLRETRQTGMATALEL